MDEILWFDHSNETSLAVLYMVLFTQCQYNPNWRVLVVVVVGGGGHFCTVWFERVFEIWCRYEISVAISRQDFSF